MLNGDEHLFEVLFKKDGLGSLVIFSKAVANMILAISIRIMRIQLKVVIYIGFLELLSNAHIRNLKIHYKVISRTVFSKSIGAMFTPGFSVKREFMNWLFLVQTQLLGFFNF